MRTPPIQGNGISSLIQKDTRASNSNPAVSKKFQQTLAKATEEKKTASPAASQYTIRQGDTLSEIVATESRKNGLSLNRKELYDMVNIVARDNRLTSPDRIITGQRLDLSSLGQIAPSAPPTARESAPPVATTPLIPKDSPRKLQPPVHGTITSTFGTRAHPVLGYNRHHDGIDISQSTGTPVVPLDSGTVTFAGKSGDYGLMVEIDHGNGLSSRYAHLNKIMVNQGDAITTNQTIGHVGATGLTTGPHLHLEVHQNDTPINPLSVITRSQIETSLMVADAGLSLPM